MKYSRNVKMLLIVSIFMNLSLFTPIETVYFTTKGVPVQIISLLNLIVPIGCAVLEIPTGIIGDCIGRKKTLSVAMGCFALSSFLLIFSNCVPMYFIIYLVEAVGWSFFSGNTDAIIVEDVKGTNLNLGAQFSFFYAGFSIAPIIAGMLNSTILKNANGDTYRMLIILTFIFKFCSFICTIFLKLKSDISKGSNEAKIIFFSCLRKVLLEKESIFIVVYEACGRLQYYVPVLTQTMLNRNGFDIKLFGVLYTLITIITAVAQFFANKILEKTNNRFVLKNSMILLVFSVMLMISNNNILIILGLLLISIVGPIRNLPLTLIKNKEIEDEVRSTYLSIISFLVLTLNFVVLSIVGFIFSYSRVCGLAALMVVIFIGGAISVNKICLEGDK